MDNVTEGRAGADAKRRAELAAFLRARRAAIQPGDVGLPTGAGRRTPGLRREEVAQRAGVGLSWYTWLEQGRPIVASPAVLDAVATALVLTHDEHAHLRRLAGLALQFPVPENKPLPTRWRRLVEEWSPNPAAVVDRHLDFLIWNEEFEAVSASDDFPPAYRGNIVLTMFHPNGRTRQANWEQQARAVLARFRHEAGKYPGDPRFDEIIRRMWAESEEFRAWWPQQAVETFTGGPQEMSLEGVGVIRIEYVPAQLSSDPDVHALLGYPVDTEDRVRLQQLMTRARRDQPGGLDDGMNRPLCGPTGAA